MNILVINGPNLNMLGKRDKQLYGNLTLNEIEQKISSEFQSHNFNFFQSNIEGEIVSQIQSAANNFDGLIINPGGYAHTSAAIKDALDDCHIPKVEVHISNLSKRDEFRQTLITASSCDGYVSGFKEKSYFAGVYLLEKLFKEK